MNEKIQMLYAKYGKLNLSISEMAREIGISTSKANKMFSLMTEKEIIKKKLLPHWKKVGNTRLWNIETILRWSEDTEVKSA